MKNNDMDDLRESIDCFEKSEHLEIENIEGKKYKTFLKRIIAKVIDISIMILLSVLITLIPDSGGVMNKIALIITSAYPIVMIFRFETTIGKAIVGIRVVNFATQKPLDISDSIIRNIADVAICSIILLSSSIHVMLMLLSGIMSLYLIWFLVDVLFAAFSSNRRAIHDRISSSVCINDPNIRKVIFGN